MTNAPTAPPPIEHFGHLIAVVTGGGSGMGRELIRMLAEQGCSVAFCDVSQAAMDETLAVATAAATQGGFASARFTSFVADVSDPAQMDAFAAHVRDEFRTEHINLLFNNAGIAGGGSFLETPDERWDAVFGVCWGGVLNGCRSFRSMLLASERGQVVNTSSVNGMWACLGPTGAHTAYSAAKFAVKGFTEALMIDFRVNAPHLTAAVVMPGHIGTAIVHNSYLARGIDPKELPEEQILELRTELTRRGFDVDAASDEDIRNLVLMRVETFENDAPTTAADAAAVILDGVKSGAWRILVGADADALDVALRSDPESAYTADFTAALLAQGHFGGLVIA